MLEHEQQRPTQTADDGNPCKNDKILHASNYLVTPRSKFLLLTGTALLAVCVTLALGRWQLSRAAQKEALQVQVKRQSALSTLDSAALLGRADLSAYHDRNVILRGHWIEPQTVFLENRQMNGKVGLYVVTPFRLDASAAVVLVQRGWVARNFLERSSLPVLQTPVGLVQLQGRIAPPPAKLYQLGQAANGRIRQNIDLAAFARETGLALLPISVVQTDPASEGLLRDWPKIGSGIEKHDAYAFQWFALSALIAFLYVWFQIVRRFTSRSRS